jgi:putative transposase
MSEARAGLGEYFAFYTAERPHQRLAYRTPDDVHSSGMGGGAKMVDKSAQHQGSAVPLRELDCNLN